MATQRIAVVLFGIFVFTADNPAVAEDVTLTDRAEIHFCRSDRSCLAISGRVQLHGRPIRVFAAKCPTSRCSVGIQVLPDAQSKSLMEDRLRSSAKSATVFLSTAGFRDRIGDRDMPDGLLIAGKQKVQDLTPKISTVDGDRIYTGGVFQVDERGGLSIVRYKDFSVRPSIVHAIQSPTILIYGGVPDFGLGTRDYSDRSAVGIGASGEFMFFLALSINETAGARPRYDAVTIKQFADLIAQLAKELRIGVSSAINMEGYSYPYVLLPKNSFAVGVNEIKAMPSIFSLEERQQ
jgi:hypothetical protein